MIKKNIKKYKNITKIIIYKIKEDIKEYNKQYI